MTLCQYDSFAKHEVKLKLIHGELIPCKSRTILKYSKIIFSEIFFSRISRISRKLLKPGTPGGGSINLRYIGMGGGLIPPPPLLKTLSGLT